MSFPSHRPCRYIRRDGELSKSWFHKLPVLTQRDSDPTSTPLCSGCDNLDLPGIVARMRLMRADRDMNRIALPPWTDSAGFPLNDGACALCAMFTANWDGRGDIHIEWMGSIYSGVIGRLSSWSPAPVVFYDLWSTKTAVFEISPTQDSHLDPMSRLLNPSSIDFDRIQHWLQSCFNADMVPQPRQKTAYLRGFRLIHCRSREITRPSQECRYVALSYVWGKNPLEKLQCQRFPRTIEDTFSVCLKLGFEYIWIDRYVSVPRGCSKLPKRFSTRQCIDQDNHEDKHAQISQMDVIYSEASLVIIAAAGDDPTYGLPGVSAQARIPQQSIKLRNCTLLQTFPEVCNEIEASTWMSRGW
ncbi:hypothetical protein GT037_002582 [Alternaria burnsii]|uniref:Heterokaryon incompatibility domain-containing protein n=1 Tax=Alternaria burnsii TaxID=1187904 RepID=A0A8H7EK80_9PLEO|nr:uncharacterized protein GT037_002582 [Alternaria burnsii]KAF7678834.1 hypothetical protein GT037_002582 [Alternaria burnsii]